MGKECIVATCSGRCPKYCTLPNDKNIREAWLTILERRDLLYSQRLHYVCYLHFRPEMFIGKKVLPTAIPFLDKSIKTDSAPEELNDEGYPVDPSDIRSMQILWAQRKKQSIKAKSRCRSIRIVLEKQDARIKDLQEQIAQLRYKRKNKLFDWSNVEAAHLISKIFEKCEPISSVQNQNSDNNKPEASTETTDLPNKPSNSCSNSNSMTDIASGNEEMSLTSQTDTSKSLYTMDFHRFAVTLFFFSPKTYFLLRNMFQSIFPNRSYIHQWVSAGHMEKLFPRGINHKEFK